jgi:hypothetical protein
MNMARYCKDKGMTLKQYETFKENIKATATAIRSTVKYNGGMYYPVNELIAWNSDIDIKGFIIHELKQLGIEFFDNNTMYRVTD